MGIISLSKASRLYWLGRYTERVYTGLKKAKPIYDAGVDGREGDYAAATVLESTLAHSLNVIGTRCLVVEMGVGMRLTKSYGEQLVDGILNLMHTQGMWAGETKPPRKPIVSKDEVAFINADKAGIFIPSVEHNGIVKKGQELAVIADPLTGEIRQTLMAPADGLLFTLREYPVVYPGSLLARILTGGFQK